MKKFHIVGAFDRHNYGDILFPLIHTKFINRNFEDKLTEIKYYAITESDLTNCGGVKTKSIRDLTKDGLSPDETVVMSGGDILGVDWPVMIGQVSTPLTYFLFRAANKLLPFKFINGLVKGLYSYNNPFPYILSRETTLARIYYTCVGGSGFRVGNNDMHLRNVCAELKLTDHISVRDKDTKMSLEKYGVKCDLVPDSALIMSDVFPERELKKREWQSGIVRTDGFDENNYFVFQSGKGYISNYIDNVVKQLADIQAENKLSILLLPIGRATGHEDDIVLQQVFKGLKVKGCNVGIQSSDHVLDIMASLAFGKCYIGTSLHGAITSYSFGNKVCGIATKKVKKLRSFLETWMNKSDYSVVDGVDFRLSFLRLIDSNTCIDGIDSLKEQKQMIYSDLSHYTSDY